VCQASAGCKVLQSQVRMLDGFRNFQNSKRFCGTDTHSCPHMSPRHSRHTLNAIGIDWPMQSFTSGEEVFPSRPGSRTPRVSCRSALKKVPRRCRHGKSHQDISGSNSLWLLMTAYDIIKYDQMLWDDTSLIFTHLHSSSLIFTHLHSYQTFHIWLSGSEMPFWQS